MADVATAFDKLQQVSGNVWWTWHPQVVQIFRELDAELWRETNHNPVLFLDRMGADRVEERVSGSGLGDRIDRVVRELEAYRDGRDAWVVRGASTLRVWPVGYFSAEFGLHESIPTYAGGLGLLAGDHLKSCSDLGVPLVGIGLLYTHGYFHQYLDETGMQHEEYRALNMDTLPLEPVMTPDGKGRLLIEVPLGERTPKLQIWRARVGRIDLYLLDSNVEENDDTARKLTGRLYASDPDIRIQQEIILGVGGVRTLAAIDRMPGALHLNEGHCAFALLEMIRLNMVWEDMSFEDARAKIGRRAVFTTHTPVPAGHDYFSPDLVERHMSWQREALGISQRDFLALGRVNPDDAQEPFCMTVLSLRLSHRANGVSALHGQTSRNMWRPLWHMRGEPEVPIGHITNGVHVRSWLAPRMFELYDHYLGEAWHQNMTKPETWEGIARVPDRDLWTAHLGLKDRLLGFIRRRTVMQGQRCGDTDAWIARARTMFDRDVLTIGFARRFAGYKRADLIFSDLDRTAKLLGNDERPVQIVFAGKAHPANEQGKKCIQRIFELCREERFKNRIAFVEDYDINVGRHLVQGVDVWLNNPIRPLEASGTSGQKVLLNGGLNCSILDGWWAEAFDGNNGFCIGYGGGHPDPEEQTHRDADNLYQVIEDEVVPLFYDRDPQGIPRRWLERVKWAIMSLGWRFNADRMVLDYLRECYLPAAGVTPCDFGRFRGGQNPG
ncbi:MAG: glycosyltransferase family 1 protein [bacterium]|nr:glycosyltransferase family 1 protein [bacterium]